MKPRPAIARTFERKQFDCAVLECKDQQVKIRYRTVLDTFEEAWISASQIVCYRDVLEPVL